MPQFRSYAPGTPCWVDVTSTDLARTNAFYGGLFGWSPQDLGEEAGGYTMYTLDGKSVAAAGPPPPGGDGTRSHWTTYLASDGVDAAAAKVTEQGGSILVEPFDVLDSGRMAIAADPGGATFGIWQARSHIGAQLANEPGTLTWNECHAADPEAAADFYAKVFGHTIEVADMGGPVPYRVLRVGDADVAGIAPVGEEEPPNWRTVFAVDDCDEAVERARELGGVVVAAPYEIPSVGRYSALSDPDGAVFGVLAG